MRLWRWYRGLRGWLQVVIAVVAVPSAAGLLYVGLRAVQYAAAEKNAGLYVPKSANVVLRVHGLEAHWARIRTTPAWQTLTRRVLGDPSFRRRVNGLLEGMSAPSLNDLEDDRRRGMITEENIMRAAGRDVALGVHVRESWSTARFVGVTRLPFLFYLGTPFAGWAVPTETRDGRTFLKVRRGGKDLFVALEGALALASPDLEFLQESLQRRGSSSIPLKPLEGRLDFSDSPALDSARRTLRECGALPHLDFDSVKALDFRCDIDQGGAFFDALLVGAEAAHPFADPPHRFVRYAPENATGILVTSAGARDIYSWMEFVAATSSWKGLRDNAGTALQTLNKHGFKEKFLPFVDHGMAILFGSEEDEGEGRQYPAVALVFASNNPSAALEGLHEAVLGIAGSQADTRLEREPVENTEIYFWRMPGAFRIDEFLRPCYVALEDAVVFGNNSSFLKSIVRTASRSGGFHGTGRYRSISRGLREYEFLPEPSYAGGLLVPPLLRQSVDGLLPRIAEQIVDSTVDPRLLRRQIEEELRQLGRATTDEEVVPRYQAALKRKAEEEERALRSQFTVLDRLQWMSFESSDAPDGMTFRAVLQLSDRRK